MNVDPYFTLTIQIIIFILCLVVSAFISGSETALTSMSKLRVKRLFREGDETYIRLESWLHDPNRYLTTILAANNFANILASVLATNISKFILENVFQTSHSTALASALAVGATTFLLLIFGEIIPKTYCKEHAVRVSLFVIRPLDWLYKVTKPIIIFFVFIANLFIRLTGGERIKEVPLLTEEDVRTIIEIGEKEGVLEVEEREMIHSIIDFGEITVKEVMTPQVEFQAIPIELTLEEVRQEAVNKGRSRIPVYENDIDSIAGILYVKDLLSINDPASFNLRKIIRPALFVPLTKKVSDLLQTFRIEKNHMAIVVDEYGLTAGLVTIEDVLEEIVGDIQDEYDEENTKYEIQEDGSLIADAKINLNDLSDVLHFQFPQEGFDTLGGFITSLSGTVPKIDEEVDFGILHFTILDSDERKINRVKIVLSQNEDTPQSKLEEKMD